MSRKYTNVLKVGSLYKLTTNLVYIILYKQPDRFAKSFGKLKYKDIVLVLDEYHYGDNPSSFEYKILYNNEIFYIRVPSYKEDGYFLELGK